MNGQRWAARVAVVLLAMNLVACAGSPLAAEISARHEAAKASIRNLKARFAASEGQFEAWKAKLEKKASRAGDDAQKPGGKSP